MPAGQRGPLSTRGTSEAGGGVLLKSFTPVSDFTEETPQSAYGCQLPFQGSLLRKLFVCSSTAMSKPSGGIARCPRCPPEACQRRLLPFPVSVMLIFKCFLVQVGDFYFFTALANKPPLKGVTPHGVGRCPQGRGDRSVRGGPAKLVEGFFREMQLLVQPCQNRPAEFARCSRCPPGACQRRWLPLPVSVMLVFRCFLV